jgi:cobalt-zinc-cadmium efflux system protein
MVMNLVIPVVQIYAGIISGSMALISDALHNLSDLTSVIVSYAALRLGKRGPSMEQTFGFKRIEVFAAVVNVALLYGVGFYIAIAGWERLQNPQPIREQIVIAVALVAFLGNAASTWMLRAGAKVNLNMKGAYVHMLTDAVTSLGVAALGVVWVFKPWYWLDPIISWVIVAMILYSGWGILKDTFLILMDATPPGIDLRAIKREVEGIEGVEEIHHVHVWNLFPDRVALAAQIIVPDQMMSTVDELAAKVRDLLFCRFGIDHPILQFETRVCDATSLLCQPVSCEVEAPEHTHGSPPRTGNHNHGNKDADK